MKAARMVAIAAVAIVSGVILFVQAHSWTSTAFISRAEDAGKSTLRLVAKAVDQAVGRFAPIPGLIADDPALRRMLVQDREIGPSFSQFINEKLRQIALSIDASEVYVINTDGLTIAASNYRDEDSFLGNNFSYRPYFSQAVAGKTAIFHALGTTSGERGFFFSAPILEGMEVIGVVAVKMTVGTIERDWPGTGREIMIADNNGIVFLTSREDFKFKALAPLSQPIRDRISETQQFPLQFVTPIAMTTDVIGLDSVQVTFEREASGEAFLANSMPLDLAGWHAIVLTPLQPIKNEVIRTLLFGGLGLLAAALTVLIVLQRRTHILQRIRIETEQRELLEQKVVERTADLDAANASLRDEVIERRHAEERLRKSQKELVQAGKLAALGQMSAAISHEINQPLAAIKSYAVNASEFLARSRVEDANANIMNISKMSDRMTEISRHLRNFARRPGDTLKPIDVAEVITETIGLVGPQLRAQAAEVIFVPPKEPVWALGGKLRLQQVLVNIVTNGLEAMQHRQNPRIEIETEARGETVQVILRDHGPGLPQEDIHQIFDAFYTTKEAGSGMGLGMSISHNIISDFGGTLCADNHPEGGAVFTVTLQRHDPTSTNEVFA